MKTIPILFLSFLLVTPLFAQDAASPSAPDLLENADMSDGTTHWHGNVKAAGSDSTTDMISGQSGGSKGIVVDLKPATWSKVTQDLRNIKVHISPTRQLIIYPMKVTIVYQTSQDFTLSTKENDYVDLGPNLGFDKAKIKGQPGQFMAFLDLPTSSTRATGYGTAIVEGERVGSTFITPKTDQQPQTVTGTINFGSVNSSRDMTFCIAIPPGTGSITFTKISLTDEKPQQ